MTVLVKQILRCAVLSLLIKSYVQFYSLSHVPLYFCLNTLKLSCILALNGNSFILGDAAATILKIIIFHKNNCLLGSMKNQQ